MDFQTSWIFSWHCWQDCEPANAPSCIAGWILGAALTFWIDPKSPPKIIENPKNNQNAYHGEILEVNWDFLVKVFSTFDHIKNFFD